MVRKWSPRHPETDSPPLFWRDACPVCRRGDHVEKVSRVVNHNSGSVVIGHSAYPYMSNLAAALKLPDAPQTPDSDSLLRRVFCSWLGATFAVLIILALRTQGALDIPKGLLTAALIATLLLLGLLIPASLVSGFVWERRRADLLMPSWVSTRQRWTRLLYCSWDDVVFMRGETEWEAPENISLLLTKPSPVAGPAPLSDSGRPAVEPAVADATSP